jgi:hypothetical protein
VATERRYVSANLTPATGKKVRVLSSEMTIETDRRVTASALVDALIEVAQAHRDELVEALARLGADEDIAD